jgi:uncharacterized membrane protein
MKSKATLFGHAIHPMLIVFPLGLLAIAVVFDAIFLFTRERTFAAVAYWDIAAGVIGGLLAAVFGLIDWMAIPIGTRAKAVGAWHGGANFVTLTLFGISWLLRYNAAEHAANSVAFVLEVVGVMIALFGGWLGGELVERLGVSVSPNANLDAPSSLSEKAGE